jgi:hypothetical protein
VWLDPGPEVTQHPPLPPDRSKALLRQGQGRGQPGSFWKCVWVGISGKIDQVRVVFLLFFGPRGSGLDDCGGSPTLATGPEEQKQGL